MGAFLLTKKENSNINFEQARKGFSKKGFKNEKCFSFLDYELFLYGKIAKETLDNYYESSGEFIFTVGTVMYKDFPKNLVLSTIYNDFICNKLSYDQLFGVFLIGIFHQNKLFFILDKTKHLHTYYLTNSFCISSSMISIAESYSGFLTIDKIHATINILSGCSFSDKTTFKEIKKLDNNIFDNNVYSKIIIKNHPVNIPTIYKNKEEAFLEQKKEISSYLARIKKFLSNNESIDIGLSGGFDSRLLLAFMHSLSLNYSIHSNYKNPPDLDLVISRKMAESLKKDLKEISVTKTEDMNKDTYFQNLEKAMYFYDGQFRVNHGWTREYRTLDYRKAVLGNCSLGLSGHNGEQYRNNDFYLGCNIEIEYFIKNYVFDGYLKPFIETKEFAKNLLITYKNYLKQKYGFKKRINHKDLRTFYSYEWVWSGPGVRASVENQLSYFLMPFAEPNTIEKALYITKYLGVFAGFESKLIVDACPELGTIQTNYGYSLTDIPFSAKIFQFIRGIIPLALINLYRHKVKKKKSNLKYDLDNEVLIKSEIPLNWPAIYNSGHEHLIDRTIAFNYLLNHFKNKINWKNND